MRDRSSRHFGFMIDGNTIYVATGDASATDRTQIRAFDGAGDFGA